MKLIIPFILISTLLFDKFLCQLNSCQVIKMKVGEIFLSKKQNPMILQTDENDFKKFNLSEYSIIRESARIQNFQVKQIISTQILPPFSINNIFEKLFCQLRKSEQYFITCIKEINFKRKERQDIQDQQKILIKLNIQEDEMCNEFFFIQNSSFLIFCIQDFYFHIYSANFEQSTTLQQQFQLEQYENAKCKSGYYKLNDNHFLIIFYQCENWGLYTYYNNTINLALNEEIVSLKYSQQIKYIENFELCQLLIVLIVETGYYQFSINLQNQLYFYVYVDLYSKLKQIVLSQNCMIIYYIQYHSLDNKTKIYNEYYDQEFDANTVLNANLFQNVLYIQTNNQLQVIYNQQFQQIIQINKSIINFDKQFNTIYQFDLISDEVILYVLSYPRNFIKVTKKYVFLIHSQSLTHQMNSTCYQINYTLNQPFESIKMLDFIDVCQNKVILYYNKKGLNLMNQYTIQQTFSSDFQISIFDNQPLFSICLKVKNILKDQTLLYLETNNQQNFFLLKSGNYIYKYSCDGQQQFIINVQSSKVYQYKNSILIWQKHQRVLRLTKFQAKETKTLEIKFKSEIINIFQFESRAVVITKNSNESMQIDFNKQNVISIDFEMEKMLNKLFDLYLQNNQQFQPFYIIRFPIQLLQFPDQLIIFKNSQFYFFEIDQVQIVLLKEPVQEQSYILGVHLIRNQIIEHVFDSDLLSILNIVNLDFEIIRPINYQINDDYFSIAVRNATKTSILIFAIQDFLLLKLLYNIQIGRVQFYFQEQYLIYYNQEDVLMIFNMADFEIQIDNVVQLKRNKATFNFHVLPMSSNDSVISLEFTLRYLNHCHQLFQTTNLAFLDYSLKNHKTKFSPINYFYGPIDTLKIIEKDYFQINGPLLFSNELLLESVTKKIYLQLNTVFPLMKYFRIIYLQFKNRPNILLNKIGNITLTNGNDQLLNFILINDQSILFIFITDYNESFIGVIYLIDEISSQLKNEPVFQFNFILQNKQSEFQSMKTGNLIVIKGCPTSLIYKIVGFSLKFIKNELSINEILKINGNNELYISLSQQNSEILLFQILVFNELQIKIIGTATLDFEIVRNQLINYFRQEQIVSTHQLCMLHFLESFIEEGQVKLTVLQMILESFVISEITIKLENFEISYRLLKIATNNIELNRMYLDYYSQKNLILRSFSGSTYFYDLTGDQIVLDYIGRYTQFQNCYHILNTTHFIIYSYQKNQISIAEIGYEITITDQYQGNKTFTLVAENMISQLHLKVIMLEINDNHLNDNNFTIICLLIIGLVLVLYILRRMILKYKRVYTQKSSGIKLIKLEQ